MPKAQCILLEGKVCSFFTREGEEEGNFWLSFDAVRIFDALFMVADERLLFVVLMLFARLCDGWLSSSYVIL